VTREAAEAEAASPPAITVYVLAESDSYLKWAAGLVASIPTLGDVRAQVVRSPSSPSPGQQAAALAGSVLATTRLEEVSPRRFAAGVQANRPDVVVLACTGPTSAVVLRALAAIAFRPVIVAGIPGVALPARPKAWTTRAGIDLFVTHSHRERTEYEAARKAAGVTGTIGLATLPYLAAKRATPADDATTDDGVADGTAATDVVFATQAKVPHGRADREATLLALAALASSRPDRTVVIKTRGGREDFHTHHESLHFEDLWAGLRARGALPAGSTERVRFSGGSMADHLARAAAFVTVSSTAALEAMALDVPMILVDEFGVGPELINEAFVGSGVLAGLDAVREGRFAHPDAGWLRANYFHPPAENTWLGELARLTTEARAGRLPPIAAGIATARTDLDDRRKLPRRVLDRLRLTSVGTTLARRRLSLRRRVSR
jgi:hypothetical protein